MAAIAKMGTSGKHPQNIERDIHRGLPQTLQLQVYLVPVRVSRLDEEGASAMGTEIGRRMSLLRTAPKPII